MKYTAKSFTVPANSAKAPADCRHGWLDAKGKCVLCGNPSPVKPERKQIPRRELPPSDWHSGGEVIQGPGFTRISLNGFGKS